MPIIIIIMKIIIIIRTRTTLLNMHSTRHRNDRHGTTNARAHNNAVCEHEDVTVLWNRGIGTEREVRQIGHIQQVKKERERERKHAFG
jgi:hypothetical protein